MIKSVCEILPLKYMEFSYVHFGHDRSVRGNIFGDDSVTAFALLLQFNLIREQWYRGGLYLPLCIDKITLAGGKSVF